MRFLAYDQPPSDDEFSLQNLSSSINFDDPLSKNIFGSWKTVALIVTTIIILFTVCGNAMTLYAVCKMKTFQNSISNIYIASLAAADMIVGAFVMTFMMLYTIAYDGRWTFGHLMCDVWQAIDFISCTVSLYSICAIGFDRWLNLEKPLRIFKRNRFTAKRALAFVWIAPVIIWTPLMIGFRLKNGPPSDGTCTFSWHPTYVVPIIAVPLFYIPVSTLMILFVRISLVIRSHLVFLHQHSNQNTTSTSLFDYDRSQIPSALQSTPASSRRRSANTPVNGSLTNLKTASNGQVNCQLITNGTTCRSQKSKPPPLSPIVSVNLTAMHTNQNSTSKGETHVSDNEPVANLNATIRGNHSPLAMKVLRDRLSLSPKLGADMNKINQPPQFPQITKDEKLNFDFDSPESILDAKPKSVGAQETTPLLGGSPTRNRSIRHKSIAACSTLELLTSSAQNSPSDQRRALSPVLFQIGGDENCSSPPKRSVSRESVENQTIVNNNLKEFMKRNSVAPNPAIKADTVDQKRSSVTSDTAVFFTKRFLTHHANRPPLLRAKTEIVLDTCTMRPKPRPSGRFSIISMTTPLFSRKYSMNIFSDMFPQCAGGIAQQIRAAKAVGVILIFFLISWAPFLVLWPLKTFCRDCVSDRLYQLSIWANYLNSTLNPILYTLCSPRFQRVFRKHCKNRCPFTGGPKKKIEPKKSLLLGSNRRNV